MEKNRRHALRADSTSENSTLNSREILMLKKKKRRRKRLLIFFAVLLCLAAAGGAGFFLWQRSVRDARAATEISAGENEELTYAQINTIVGNEVEVTILSGITDEAAGENAAGRQNGARAEDTQPEGAQPDSMPTEDRAMTQSREAGESGQAPAPAGQLSPAESGETREWQIPVGTDVITSLGVTTTFSRLSAGDVIAVLTEVGTDNILKIWIVQ